VGANRLTPAVALVLAAAAASLLAGCGGEAGAEKAGGRPAPTVLKLADGYDPGLELEPAVAYFVKRVGQLSRGELRIRVVDDWAGNRPGMEQIVVRAVASGKADLGWAGTRVLDTLGVTSFRALTAPMLIDSYALERAVIASKLPGEMMEGLDPDGVAGLGVLGGGLRRPIALDRPLLRPADCAGSRSPPSGRVARRRRFARSARGRPTSGARHSRTQSPRTASGASRSTTSSGTT